MADALLEAFARQVSWCSTPAPFTAHVLARSRLWLAQDAAAHAAFTTVAADPLAAAVPLRWAGALHHLALRGLSPWAALWSAASASDEALDAAIRSAWSQHRHHCEAALALPPQTNEVNRSAVLLPGLLHIAAHTQLPMTLLEIGASAGLNLWCDRFHYDYGSWQWGDVDSALHLHNEWRGKPPDAAQANLHIVRRAACDASPIRLDQAGESLRLASFIWPDQAERLVRLRTACALVQGCMQAQAVAVQALPAAEFVQRELQTLPRHQATVLMHSVVWQYIAADEQTLITQHVHAAGQAASAVSPLAWLRMEPPGATGDVELRCTMWPGGDDQLLARCHPHGAWVQWLG
jgi:hypothetical protein